MEWTATFGAETFGNGVDVDSQGNVYQAGSTFLVSRFPPDFCFSSFVNKYSPQGQLLWSQELLDSGACGSAFGVAVDTGGFIYASGVRTNAQSRAGDLVLAKFNFAGQLQWRRIFDSGGEDFGLDVAFEPARQFVHVLNRSRDASKSRWLRYDTNGSLLFQQTISFPGSRFEDVSSMAADSSGLVVAASVRILNPDAERVGVARYNFDGTLAFATTVFFSDPPRGITLDSSGNSILAVDSNIGRAPFLNTFSLLRFDSQGRLSLHIHDDSDALNSVQDAATDPQGNLYGSGRSGSFLSGGTFLTEKFSAVGQPLWKVAHPFFNRGAQATNMALDASGNVYISGLVRTPSGTTLAGLVKFKQAGAALALKITFDPSEVRPLGTGDNSATQVQVTLTDPQGNPAADKDVTFAAEPVGNSGGHDHDGNRPVGTFSGGNILFSSPPHGRTGPDGKLTATYTASAFGGQETIKVHVTDTPSVSTSAVLEVRVPGLTDMPASGLPRQYNLTGSTQSHPNNHFALSSTTGAMVEISRDYGRRANRILGINDLSLNNGGLFDIRADWRKPHNLHRLGRSADIDRGSERADRPGEFVIVACEDDIDLQEAVAEATGSIDALICESQGRKHIEFP